jgi:hypothetical protein
MGAAVNSKITSYAAEDVLFGAPEREDHSEILDIGDPESWCPCDEKFLLYLTKRE